MSKFSLCLTLKLQAVKHEPNLTNCCLQRKALNFLFYRWCKLILIFWCKNLLYNTGNNFNIQREMPVLHMLAGASVLVCHGVYLYVCALQLRHGLVSKLTRNSTYFCLCPVFSGLCMHESDNKAWAQFIFARAETCSAHTVAAFP